MSGRNPVMYLTVYCVIIMTHTPSWGVSDLQSPSPRAQRALGFGDCKSDTAHARLFLFVCFV